MVYLDAASTAKYSDIDSVVVNAITTAMKDNWHNPSSLYAANVKEEINKCRKNIAKFIVANSEEIIFTSGASESNNMAIRGWVDNVLADNYKTVHIITTPIEHKSVLLSLQNKNLRACIHYCDVDEYGFVDYNSLKQLLAMCDDEPVLVSVGMSNNEIGTNQDIRKISDLVHRYDGVLHVDGTQALGHIPINVKELGIDMMSCSGHKISPVLSSPNLLTFLQVHFPYYFLHESMLQKHEDLIFSVLLLFVQYALHFAF